MTTIWSPGASSENRKAKANQKIHLHLLRCEKGLVTSQPARILQNKLTTTTTSPETLLSSFSVGHLLLGMGLSLKSGFVHSETPLGENQLFLWDQILEIVSGTKAGPLQEQPMLWTTELFLHPISASFYKWHLKAYKWKLTESLGSPSPAFLRLYFWPLLWWAQDTLYTPGIFLLCIHFKFYLPPYSPINLYHSAWRRLQYWLPLTLSITHSYFSGPRLGPH